MAVRTAEKALSDKADVGTGASPAEESVRFTPSTALSFPASDILAIQWTDKERSQLHLVLSFLGLYGVSSPLPSYFHEMAASESLSAKTFRAFLNLFNQRLYAFFYRAWRKFQIPVSFESLERGKFEQILFCLAGLGTRGSHLRYASPTRLLASAGLLGGAVRSARGLEQVLSEYFRVPVHVTERVASWRTNPAAARLGQSGVHLGRSLAIGFQIKDAASCFRVTLGPLTLEQARQFLRGNDSHRALREIVRLYAPDFLDFEIHLTLRLGEAPPVVLGAVTSPLGWLCWLGQPVPTRLDIPLGRFSG